MSQREAAIGREDDEVPELARDLASKVARETAPGKGNDEIVASLQDLPGVVESFVEDTNNWFEVIDVRTHRNGNIGIPCRYRWTIKRWVVNDTDTWLIDNGWDQLAHLFADSKEHEENEMEARYRKEIDGYTIWMNAYVEFTNDVFEAMQKGEPIQSVEEKREKREKVERVRQQLRED